MEDFITKIVKCLQEKRYIKRKEQFPNEKALDNIYQAKIYIVHERKKTTILEKEKEYKNIRP